MDYIGVGFLVLGLFFFVVGIIGIIRLPDAFSRLHATGKVVTMGLFGLLVGGAFLMPAMALKALTLGLFMLVAGPVVAHAIGVAESSPDAVRE